MFDQIVGRQIGPYRLKRVIGRGGMAVVYLAEEKEPLEREVALKILAPELSQDDVFRDRFVREARLLAGIEHPNIVPIYSAGEWEGFLVLAMRYIDGRDLRVAVVEQGRLSPLAAIHILAQVASALDFGHARGIVHRDVKPGNILIEGPLESGHAYLTDFGLALRHTQDVGLTRTGQFMGTLSYVAPEQIQGEAVDARTDVYALGCVLFHVLTGAEPFTRDSDVAVLFAHINDAPPTVSDLVTGLPVQLDAVIARALAKDPRERYASAGALARDAAQAMGMGVTRSAADLLGTDALAPAASAPVSMGEPAAPPPQGRSSSVRAAPPPLGQPPSEPAVPQAPAPVPPPPPEPPPSLLLPSVAPSEEVRSYTLDHAFRFVHEPLIVDDDAIPFIGNDVIVDAIHNRLLHSNGGAFLITGFRGVGKTTVVGRALQAVAESATDRTVVPIWLNVARPMTTEQLLFEVVRRLFERLVDQSILDRLPPDIQRALIIAYTRTSLSFKETRSKESERSRSLDIGLGGIAPLLKELAPSLELSKKETRSLATEASFLAYSASDVEHDFLRIIWLLNHELPVEPSSRWDRFRDALRRKAPGGGARRTQVIVVIDELDKLTAATDDGNEGLKTVEQILMGLKNLLTSSGVHFLFVGGPELHDAALRESQRGNSVFESVFGWQLYIPCVWEGANQLMDAVTAPDSSEDAWFSALREFMAFKARGVPRLLLLQLNSLVKWEDGTPRISLSPLDARRVRFYARLQAILQRFVDQRDSASGPFAIPIDEDRWRLGAYYVADWILRSRGRVFTIDEIVKTGRDASIDPMLVISQASVRRLVNHLLREGVLTQVGGRADQTMVREPGRQEDESFQVVDEIYRDLETFKQGDPGERVELGSSSVGSDGGDTPTGQPWADPSSLGTLAAGRYQLLNEIDRLGKGTVYLALDTYLQREVAIKIFQLPRTGPSATRRFEREAKIATSIDHPNIVSTFDVIKESETKVALVMAFVSGVSLKTALSWGRFETAEAVRIAHELLHALAYVHELGIARIDLKPGNIMLTSERRPVIVDVGLAKEVHEQNPTMDGPVTVEGAIVATPAYAAPEQLTGGLVDIRSDLYTLGLVLFEMLSGRRARPGEDFREIMVHALQGVIDVGSLRISEVLRAVLAKALEQDPHERFQSPVEMDEALLGAAEAKELATVARAP